jgi:hypothetical protein
MCPFCLASTLGFVVAGTVSTGGLAALALKMSRKKKREPSAGVRRSGASGAVTQKQ